MLEFDVGVWSMVKSPHQKRSGKDGYAAYAMSFESVVFSYQEEVLWNNG